METAMHALNNYINGEWIASPAKEHLDVENPATSDVLARVPLSSPNEADADEKEALKTWLLDVLLGTEAKVPPQLSRA